MATILKTRKKSRKQVTKRNIKGNKNKGFDKAWEFWKGIQVDLTNFKFDREEANAR